MNDADFVVSAMPMAAINCPGTTVPEGSFPVSLKLGWHGGIHVHAPANGTATLPVRAIADGEVIFARKPTAQVTDATHPQNYNPYGEGAAWTDNGMVILRHMTDIGDGEHAERIVFYSIIMHFSELRGTALKVANGTAHNNQRKVFRKEILGAAGRVYNAADHIHLEIVADDANCRTLTGRATGSVSLDEDGRVDAVYGEIYFHLPAGTKFYSTKPHPNLQAAGSVVCTTDAPLIVGLRHGNGEGATGSRGDDYLTTYQLDGSIVGNAVKDHNAEYEMYSRSLQISEAFPVGERPRPSAVYELLRFGRIINRPDEVLIPAECPHWRCVSYGNDNGWVNLNATGVTKYSDADFPHWKSWAFIDDDSDGDSRADSSLLMRLIQAASGSDNAPTREEAEKQLNIKEVRDKLNKSICKFPSEWDAGTIDARWGWLQTCTEHQLIGDDWTNFRAHVIALGIPTESLPQPLRNAHWHFHPLEFITQFRKCQWINANELKQLVPRHAMRRHGGIHLWEAVQTDFSNENSIARTQRVALNKSARKYGISSPLRLSSFYGNAIQETRWLQLLAEGNGDSQWYSPWYGRGFLQLTHPGNYIEYWRFRGRQVPESLKAGLMAAAATKNNINLQDHLFPQLTSQIRGWREEIRGVQTEGSKDAFYAPADSAGFYWAMLKMALYADSDHVLQRVTVITNHGPKALYRSPSFWRTTAVVNLPVSINMLYSEALNGFEARCIAYSYSLATLSEVVFPNTNGLPSFEFPEGYLPRRE